MVELIIRAGNTGLGAATVKSLAQHKPDTICICARPISLPTAEKVASEVRTSFPEINLQTRALDLSSFDSIKAFSSGFLEDAKLLDFLLLNAGVSSTAPTLTEDGYETQFGINYLGHVFLTQLLMPLLLETARRGRDVRILITSSMAAYFDPPSSGLALGEMRTADSLKSAYQRYAHSKLALVLFARRLSLVYPSLTVVSFNPGQVRTGLFRKANGINKCFMMFIGMPLMWLTGVSPDRGALNGLWAMSSRNVSSGSYYEPIGILEDRKRYLTDINLMNQLWDWTNTELQTNHAPGWPEP